MPRCPTQDVDLKQKLFGMVLKEHPTDYVDDMSIPMWNTNTEIPPDSAYDYFSPIDSRKSLDEYLSIPDDG